MSLSYFDETIFTTGESLVEYSKINVFNDADAYLVAKQNIEVGYNCDPFDGSQTEEKVSDENGRYIVNLNPRSPCIGINIYSMIPANKQIKKLVDFNQISVYDGETTTEIGIGEHIPGSIYTVGTLTPFESAIMIKYFAINNTDVYITRHLYRFIRKFFDDNRSWFNYNAVGVVQNHNNELIFDDEIINIPVVTYSGYAVDLN